MILPNVKVIDRFSALVSDAFLHDLVREIKAAYSRSEDEYCDVHPKLRREHRPIQRRVLIDTRLETVAKNHFEVKAEIRDNCIGSHSYTELIISEKVILTTSSVNSPKQLPRPSKFRLEAALNNPEIKQLGIFEQNIIHTDFINKKLQNISSLYGIIIHGPSKSAQPNFILVAIPDSAYQYQIATINLLKRFSKPTTSTDKIDLSVEEVDKPSARLRVRIEADIEEEKQVAFEDNERRKND